MPVRINRVYTKSGDKGDTRLGDGSTRRKDDARIEAYGTIDELNSAIGQALSVMPRASLAEGNRAKESAGEEKVFPYRALLLRVQNHLFDIGSDLCRPESPDKKNRFPEHHSLWLEQQIDRYNAALAPLTSFVLPSGSARACALHLARTVARRAERRVITLADREQVASGVLLYLNRLSDLLFVLARYYNDKGEDDILWQPNKD